ncbi:MAG: sigma-70 family RNA polymerase sigma factor [Dysgonamonadaceae bacterium]|jgi:RNA polymerase sigma-70 factor (ECF subfamily)|nr:sigma-70 family RNA polymerase sigma factor [Dysgonamonadaceae bacterium]
MKQSERFKTEIIPIRQNLLLTAKKYLQNTDDAEDAVQETLLRLWQIRDRTEVVANLQGFAVQTLKNICLDRLKAEKECVEIDNFPLEASPENPHTEAERRDLADFVRRIIEQLPPLQRLIIRMRDVEGCEMQEIADITGTSLSAATMNLSRARKKVREQLIIENEKLKYGKH